MDVPKDTPEVLIKIALALRQQILIRGREYDGKARRLQQVHEQDGGQCSEEVG